MAADDYCKRKTVYHAINEFASKCSITWGLLVRRAPTLAEALAVDANDIRQGEAWAMRAALEAQRRTGDA